MSDAKLQEFFGKVLLLAGNNRLPFDVRLAKIRLVADAALEELRAEQRRKEDQAIHIRQTQEIVEDENGMVFA